MSAVAGDASLRPTSASSISLAKDLAAPTHLTGRSVSCGNLFRAGPSSVKALRVASRAKFETMNLQDFDRTQVLAAHMSRQQSRLRRNIHTVESDEQWKIATKKLMASSCSTLVFFRRQGCPSCNHMAPKFSEASNDFEVHHGGEVAFVEVDVHACPRTSSVYRAESLAPAFCVFNHGVHQSSFSGVSTQVFQKHLEEMRAAAITCPQCTSDMRACFKSLDDNLCEVVENGVFSGGEPVCVAQYEGVGRRASVETAVPSGDKIVQFDISSFPEPLKSRLQVLEERVHGPPSLSQLSYIGRHRTLATQFLALHVDDGLRVAQARHDAAKWLRERFGHPSLWGAEEHKAVSTISDAVIARRAARAEYWLLRSLTGIRGRSSTHRQWSEKLRASLYSKLCDLWMALRPCLASCSNCELPCVLPHNHSGRHYCGVDDHICHRYVDNDEQRTHIHGEREPRSRCQLYSGHRGPCRGRPPSADPGEKVCAICLEALPRSVDMHFSGALSIPAQRSVVFPCKHAFHSRCAELCLQRSSLCPLCRSPTHASDFRGKLDTRGFESSDLVSRQESSTHLQQLRHLSRTNRTLASGITALPLLENLTAAVEAQALRALSTRSTSTNASYRPALPPVSGREAPASTG